MGRMNTLLIMATNAGIDPQLLVDDLREAVKNGKLEPPLTDEDIQKFIKENY